VNPNVTNLRRLYIDTRGWLIAAGALAVTPAIKVVTPKASLLNYGVIGV